MEINKNDFIECEKILGKFNILSPEETIDVLYRENKSITRFGDGEFDMIYGKGMNYQKYDEKLARRLKEVIKSDNGILVGIPNVFNLDSIDKYTEYATEFWTNWIDEYKFRLIDLLDRNKKYYSSQISRFYLDYKDKSNVSNYVKKLKQIWNDKDVLIIEGEKSRLGIGNDLFDNMKSIQRIICPSENAFDVYDKIYEYVVSKVDKDKLILIALGPTATVLSYDLYNVGFHTIDIGHVDIEYEWFLRKATKKIKIENKYVTEVKEGRINISDVKDQKYENEIIIKIF